MKPNEILAAFPQWADMSPDAILESPAWTLPCRLGDKPCTMRFDALRPSETLDLAIRFEDEVHVLGIADSPAFPELHAVWPSRADVPEPILLALVEKDCGEFLQLLENAVRRQLKIVGLAAASEAPAGKTACAQVIVDDAPAVVFTLDLSPMVTSTLGQLRNIDASHPSVSDTALDAEIEYAAFTLPSADLAALSPGDALLLTEIGTLPPRTIVAGRLVVSDAGVSEWTDDARLRVCAAEASSVMMGAILAAADGSAGDAAAGSADDAAAKTPPENTQLKLVRNGATLAAGFLGHVGSQTAFIVESCAVR